MVRLAAVPLTAALFFACAIEAPANHIAGATYNGTWGNSDPFLYPDREVSFTVTPDGAGISSFSITGPVWNGCEDIPNFEKDYAPPLPITNHAFTDNSLEFMLNGSFPEAQSASGTYQILKYVLGPPYYVCDSGEYPWSATTTPPTPPPDPDPAPDPDPDPAPDPDPDPDPAPDPAPDPQPEPDEQPDTVAPALALVGKLVQKLGKAVRVGVVCRSEACVARATGFVDVPRTAVARRLRLKGARANIAAGDRKRLKLRMSRKTRRAARRALRRGKKVKAKVRVAVRDAAGNRTVRRRTIRLRR